MSYWLPPHPWLAKWFNKVIFLVSKPSRQSNPEVLRWGHLKKKKTQWCIIHHPFTHESLIISLSPFTHEISVSFFWGQTNLHGVGSLPNGMPIPLNIRTLSPWNSCCVFALWIGTPACLVITYINHTVGGLSLYMLGFAHSLAANYTKYPITFLWSSRHF